MPCQTPTCNFSIYDEDALDMAIFISPQYKDDDDILDAIYTYIDAVYDDIRWNVGIVTIESGNNKYDDISDIIQSLHHENPLKACLMVGEDIGVEHNYIVTSDSHHCVPAIQGWSSVDGWYVLSTTCDIQMVAYEFVVDISIALLFPCHNDAYETKKEQLISVFNKFSTGRDRIYDVEAGEAYALFDEKNLGHNGDYRSVFEGEVPYIGDATIVGNPQQSVVDSIRDKSLNYLVILGHAFSNVVHPNPGVFKKTVDLDKIDCPYVNIEGCYTDGWWSDVPPSCAYTMPSRSDFFGHSVFENPNLRAYMGGSIGWYATSSTPDRGYLAEGGLRRMASGMTIAESMIGVTASNSRCIIFGDPTFHYQNTQP